MKVKLYTIPAQGGGTRADVPETEIDRICRECAAEVEREEAKRRRQQTANQLRLKSERIGAEHARRMGQGAIADALQAAGL